MSRAPALRALIAPLLLVLLWQVWASNLPARRHVPTPTKVFAAAYELIATGELPLALGQSLLRCRGYSSGRDLPPVPDGCPWSPPN